MNEAINQAMSTNDYDTKKRASEYFDWQREGAKKRGMGPMTLAHVARSFGIRPESLRNWRCNHRATRNR